MRMQLLLFQSFSIVVALALGLAASAIFWSKLRKPWLFLAVGTLAMLGLERLLTTLWTYGNVVFGTTFLEHRPVLTAQQIANPELSVDSVAIALVLLGIGFPLLLWLRRATSHA